MVVGGARRCVVALKFSETFSSAVERCVKLSTYPSVHNLNSTTSSTTTNLRAKDWQEVRKEHGSQEGKEYGYRDC